MRRESFDDVLVVLPGIMGSTLRDRHGHEVWGQQAMLLHGVLRGGIGRLVLPAGVGDEHPGDGIRPGQPIFGVYASLGAWSTSLGYGKLIDHLTSRYTLVEYDEHRPDRPANLVLFGYDWRLSNRYNGRRLKHVVEPVLERWRSRPQHRDAKLVFLCHSMGGLVARWYVQREGGAALTRTLVTVGTPHRGAATAIQRLVDGVRLTLGRFGVDLTSLTRSLPSLYQLLPSYACLHTGTGLQTITEAGGLPGLCSRMVADGASFHRELDEAEPPPGLRPIIGIGQPTMASARIESGTATLYRTMPLDGSTTVDRRGDGTVPRFAAYPTGYRDLDPSLAWCGQTHGGLPGHQSVLEHVDGVLTGTEVEFRAVDVPLGIEVDQLVLAGEDVTVHAETADPDVLMEARLLTTGVPETVVSRQVMRALGDGSHVARFPEVPPGGYLVQVGRPRPNAPLHNPVTAATVVVHPAALADAVPPRV